MKSALSGSQNGGSREIFRACQREAEEGAGSKKMARDTKTPARIMTWLPGLWEKTVGVAANIGEPEYSVLP
jgi:hypothetical protein